MREDMILTVTLNPAVDKTYTTGALMLGQVNRMRTVNNIAGGKGINVAKILRQYGYEVATAGFLGGYTGQFIENCMQEIHALCRFTKVAGETRSSINVIAEDGYVTEILEPGPVISAQELECFTADYEKEVENCDLVIMSGSVAKGIPADIYRKLVETGKKAGRRCILDTSGEALLHGIKAAPFMIKPNQKELEYLVGHKLKDIGEIGRAAEKLRGTGIEHVLVSLGKKGLLSVTEGETLWAKPPAVKAVNTVGCGDSVVASYAMSLLKGEDNYTALKRAAAISAANTATLESGDIALELAEDLLERVEIERR
ncbi:MAG: 1-phosphofructokinase [Lachnospiraceae bacterium]|nr:1-phosphofructokinase [Lachnospiraceae bacterium]